MTDKLLLRNANEEDCNLLFNWRNEEETVNNSITGPVKYSEHLVWFKSNIQNRNNLILIVESKNSKCGMVRFEKKDKRVEVSINISSEYQGKGLGSKSLEKAIKIFDTKHSDVFYSALIKKSNLASIRIFKKAGFVFDFEREGVLTFSKSKKKIFNDRQKLFRGLKIWSSNIDLHDYILKAYEEEKFDFLEIKYIPGEPFQSQNQNFRNKGIPIGIHFPDERVLDLNSKLDTNSLELIHDIISFSDSLSAEYILFHPGFESINSHLFKNIKKIGDSRLIVENVPKVSIDKKIELFGHDPDVINSIIDKMGCQFCLDFSHAIKASCSLKQDPEILISKFLSLNPSFFHVTDGNRNLEQDQHLNLGEGDFELESHKESIIRSKNKAVLFETPKKGPGIANDIKNIQHFEELHHG